MGDRGFTLVELIIVIAVLGILGSQLLPNFSSVQDRAKESAVKAVAHALQVAVEAYYLNNGAYPIGSAMGVASLSKVLVTSGDLAKTPANPFTQATYTDTDSSGKILYTHAKGTSYYTFSASGLGNSKVILTLTNR